MDAIQVMEAVNDLIVPIPRLRIIRDRINPTAFYREGEFKRRFRMSKNTVLQLTDSIAHLLQHATDHNHALPPIIQVCGCLRLLAGGSFQIIAGDLINVSQSTISRTMNRFLNAIITLRRDTVKFPNNLVAVRQQFHNVAGFPGVIGLVDGTHIAITKPSNHENPDIFRNRKRTITLNVQIISGPDLTIYNIVSRWPGSTHDSRVFHNSIVKDRLETGDLHNGGLLLGDKGYACLSYLMTPIRVTQTEAERRYNASHVRTRTAVERCIGTLKKRFPCLTNRMMYAPAKAARIIIACAILHNIAIFHRDDDFGALARNRNLNRRGQRLPDMPNGLARRRAIIEQHFRH